MADDKKSSTDSKVFDVAKPAKSGAATAKSVAIPKRAMMASAPGENDVPAEDATDIKTPKLDSSAVSSTSGGKLKLEPISKPEDLQPKEEAKPEETQPAADTTASPDIAEDTDGNTEPSGRDKLKDASSDEQDVVDSKEAERQANYEKIIAAKTYFLPINQVVRRRSKHVAIAGIILIILLCIAWLDISLDAGLVSIPGVKAPTHFFSK